MSGILENGFIGAGDVSLKNLDVTGAGFIPVGNAQALSVQPSVERKQRKSKKRDTHGQVLGSRAIIGDIPVKITLDTANRSNIAKALLGQDADYTQAAAEDQSASVALKHDQWVDLPHMAVENVDVAVGSVTAVEGTDYEVDANAGMVMALSSGSLADDAEATVSYDAGAISGYAVEGAVQAEVNVAVRLSGVNLDNNDRVILDIYQVKFSPSSAMDFLSDDYTSFELDGLAETPDGKDHPFKLVSWSE